MKKILSVCLVFAMCLSFCACARDDGAAAGTQTTTGTHAPEVTLPQIDEAPEIPAPEVENAVSIRLEGESVTVDGVVLSEQETAQAGVYLSRDIVYYEEKTAYESGNPYGEGTTADMHSAQEAASHLVVNITEPGNYRVSGRLELGQIRIDLGEKADEDPDAVVNLVLDGVDITCTVAPAILFVNVYECDGDWSEDTAKSDVDTSAAGANLILAEGSRNKVSGAYVAKIFKDKDGEKKLWKQDGAIYSYMSMNVYGPGALDLYAENEGLDTELHLTINGGSIAIHSGNDGINTNEDGVSVTTINGGTIHIIAGLGEEGDGIDSNGYLVINGGTVVSSANPAADAGLDSDLGSYINGGTVIALGSTMDWAESDSNQVTMNLQFADYQSGGSAIVVTQEDGTVVFAYDPSEDEVLGENVRRYMGAVISSPYFQLGQGYHVYLDGTVTGEETGGMYDVTTVTGYAGGVQQSYTGSDVGMGRPGGMGGFGGGQRPDGMEFPEGERPEDMTRPDMPEGEIPTAPEGESIPKEWWRETPPDGFGGGKGQRPGNFGGDAAPGEANTLFFMQDKVNAFSGVSAAE